MPYPAEYLRGDSQTELSSGLEAVGASTQSESRSDVFSVLGVTTEGGESPNCAGEVGISSPAKCTRGREQATPLLGYTQRVLAQVVSYHFDR